MAMISVARGNQYYPGYCARVERSQPERAIALSLEQAYMPRGIVGTPAQFALAIGSYTRGTPCAW